MSGLCNTASSSTGGVTVITDAGEHVVIMATIRTCRSILKVVTEERAMQVVSITGERRCEVVERPEPKVAANFAKVKILAAPMCTEVRDYWCGRQTDCLGHEAAGVVVEAGPQCKIPVGTRVIAMPLHGC